MDLAGKRVTVMGLGRFGGGVGVTRWLVDQGADVLVTDLEPVTRLVDSVARLSDLVDRGTVTLRLGEHNVSDFTTCDLVVANPAVPRPWENRFLRAATSASIPITTEIELSVRRLPDRSRVLAVTGSAGKSTTAAMIHHALTAAGREAVFGGNIGGSLLSAVGSRAHRIGPQTFVVLELSSFMLHWLGGAQGSRGWSPHVAVVTNLSPNHLDWHVTPEHYRTSKANILASQEPGDAAVLGPGVSEWPLVPGVARRVVGPDARVEGLALPGAHNALNAGVALAAACELDRALDPAAAAQSLRRFAGLPHRLQLVARSTRDERFFNDSKSTTPESTLLAVESLRDAARGLSHVHLIAGGYDKGSDLSPVAMLAAHLAGLYTIGATGPAIASEASDPPGHASTEGRVFECGTLAAAFAAARSRLSPGDVVLLSPACASWDQYENFERRGEEFVALASAAAGTAERP